MLHKMGVLFHCEECRRAVMENETDYETDYGADLCGDCVLDRHEKANRYWTGSTEPTTRERKSALQTELAKDGF